ncbi:hypothetical protein BDZ90DRAFT_257457 [Jaminaea rosea]|uniref:DH domain-containing protein n=1 Tax=Jaminaea rosea TaxID=1569628 RepID=A0A316UYI5_9BASI|nr:hypothetical protein BDZ90DRAFT_257457 [Jaminaea rosea]PWN30377.1 hypothetical protein BDZ90DRAFT_257457 [Jaminaea rosea]
MPSSTSGGRSSTIATAAFSTPSTSTTHHAGPGSRRVFSSRNAAGQTKPDSANASTVEPQAPITASSAASPNIGASPERPTRRAPLAAAAPVSRSPSSSRNALERRRSKAGTRSGTSSSTSSTAYTPYSQQHHRSMSVQSQASSSTATDGASSSGRDSLLYRKASSRATATDGSDSLGSLHRSRSSASTIPTSPDTEPLVVISKQAATEAGILLSGATGEAQDTAPMVTKSMHGGMADLNHRNKPLPVPGVANREGSEALLTPQDAYSHSIRSAAADESVNSIPSSSSAAVAPKSPTMSSRSTLRSALISGGKYLKTNQLWGQPSTRQARAGAQPPSSESDTHSSPIQPSPSASTSNVSDAGGSATSSKEATASSHPPRSHSPFLFKRMSKSNLHGTSPAKSMAAKSASTTAVDTSTPSYFSLRRGSRARQELTGVAHEVEVGEAVTAPRLQQAASEGVTETSQAPTSAPEPLPSLPLPSISRSPPSTDLATFMTPFTAPPLARPPLTRTRSKSVGEVEGHLSGGAMPAAAADLSPTSVDVPLPEASQLDWFHLPPIETSQQSFMGSGMDRQASSRRAPSSFKWTRVLSKKGSMSGKPSAACDCDEEQPPPLPPPLHARTSIESRRVASPRGSNVSKQSSKTVKQERGDVDLARLRKASAASARSQETSPRMIRKQSRKGQNEGTQVYVAPKAAASTSSVRSKSSAAGPSGHRKTSSGSVNASSPLSPNLAQLWSTAVRMGEPVDFVDGGEDSIDEVERMLPPPLLSNTSVPLPPTSDGPSPRDQSANPQLRPPIAPLATTSDSSSTSPRSNSDRSDSSLHASTSTRKTPGRSTFTRTLATVFDPRPSVAGRNDYTPPRPTSPPMPLPPRSVSSMSGLITRRIGATPRGTSKTLNAGVTPTRGAAPVPSPRTSSAKLSSSRAQASLAADPSPSPSRGGPFGRRSLDLMSNIPTPPRRIESSTVDSPYAIIQGGSTAVKRVARGRPTAPAQTRTHVAPREKTASTILPRTGTAASSQQARAANGYLPPLSSRRIESEQPDSPDRSIPPRSSSQPGGLKSSKSTRQESPVLAKKPAPSLRNPAAASKLSPGALKIDTSVASAPRQRMPRPSSSLGVYGLDSDAPTMRRLNRPHLQDLDDKAFLEMLEGARRQHNEQAAKDAEKAEKITRMAQMGMATGYKASRDVSGRENTEHAVTSARPGASGSGDVTSRRGRAVSNPRSSTSRRSSSADGRLGGKTHAEVRHEVRGASQGDPAAMQALAGGNSFDSGLHAPLALTAALSQPHPPGSIALVAANVGHASGQPQLHNAFANDDDWKREVRALFIIRELLATEKSYARHLESLLQAVRKKAIAPSSSSASPSTTFSAAHGNRSGNGPTIAKRKSVVGLSSVTSTVKSSSSNSPSSGSTATAVPIDRHLPLMRNLLPQLIALSRTLSSRIDSNPTASGVGAAFAIVAPQLEATFVAWSTAANEIMAGLRHAQGPRGKAKDRLVLTLAPYDSTEAHGVSADSAAASSPSSSRGVSHRFSKSMDAHALTRPSSPELRGGSTRVSVDCPPAFAATSVDAELGVAGKKVSKRRSTISSVHPRNFTKSKASTSGSADALGGDRIDVNGRSISRKGSLDALNSQSVSGPPPSPSSRIAMGSDVSPIAPASQPPSRSASPWGFASTRRSLAAAASKRLSSSMSTIDVPATFVEQSPSGGIAAASAKALSPLDVAIMPLQRPPRYLLLLAELVRNTPASSLSHARVTRSLEAMRGIAAKCDVAAAATAAQEKTTTTGGTRKGSGTVSSTAVSRSTTPSAGASPTAPKRTGPSTLYR